MSGENTSTPKRRRLGTGRILLRPRPIHQDFEKDADLLNSPSLRSSSPYTNDDLPLPCNQIEYLCDSGNTSSTSSDVPCSSGVLSSCVMNKEVEGSPLMCTSIDKEDCESLAVSENHNAVNEVLNKSSTELNEIEDITDDMFSSKLEQVPTQCSPVDSTLLTSRCEEYFRANVEESFAAINKSICNIQNEEDKSFLFDTKDSLFLDVKESEVVAGDQDGKSNPGTSDVKTENNSFYGLPLMAKALFKTYRNIEKFYDWQEECLNLDAIKERRNLIYALPTSGGKTLVAEVLMLREVLNRKKNALFILPFVAIVQEKMWALAPFALALDFLAEEYAGGRGALPPPRRRGRRSVFVATIEKGLALVRALLAAGRLDELGLVVVDELHLLGEPGRGATLETLLTTVLFTEKPIQVVGMSATLGAARPLAAWLRAALFERPFRPVALAEYVKLGRSLLRLRWGPAGRLQLEPARELRYDYSERGAAADPDQLGGLVAEVVPRGACLVFCPTQRGAESVAELLYPLQRREMAEHRPAERAALAAALAAEGAGGALLRCVRRGLAYHHAGLPAAARALLEHAYRAGVVSALSCTSTLAAGVNLPAARVLVRAPRVGRAPLSLAAYRQMAGRAGRAGLAAAGECITICSEREWPALRATLSGGLPPVRSVLAETADGVAGLVLSGVALRLAGSRALLRRLLARTLLAAERAEPTDPSTSLQPASVDELCDEALRELLRAGAVAVAGPAGHEQEWPGQGQEEWPGQGQEEWPGQGQVPGPDDLPDLDTELVVTPLGQAAIKGGVSVAEAARLVAELRRAARALVLLGPLHLLQLVAPAPAAPPDPRHYYSLYCELDEEGILTANALGITQANAIRMMTGKPITGPAGRALGRFYVALLLRELWRGRPCPAVAAKFGVSAGGAQALAAAAGAAAGGAAALCEALPALWPLAALLPALARRLRSAARPHLAELLRLPGVHQARAAQLARAGFARLERVAAAAPGELARALPHVGPRAAALMVSAARMMLIEKVENLRSEAEDVMDKLKV